MTRFILYDSLQIQSGHVYMLIFLNYFCKKNWVSNQMQVILIYGIDGNGQKKQNFDAIL